MPFPFKQMRLEADGFFDLIGTWAEMQLVVTKDSAEIIGDGFTHEVLKAFTALVFDWEARIPLPKDEIEIPEGSYDLSRKDDVVHACQGERTFRLMDRPVVMEIQSVPEN